MSYTNVNETFIVEPLFITGDTTIWSACTALYTNEIISCSGDSSIIMASGEIAITKDLTPDNPNVNLGTPSKRFRQINTVSGSSSVWASTNINTTSINLGLDSQGNQRILTADSSVLKDDTLVSGFY